MFGYLTEQQDKKAYLDNDVFAKQSTAKCEFLPWYFCLVFHYKHLNTHESGHIYWKSKKSCLLKNASK